MIEHSNDGKEHSIHACIHTYIQTCRICRFLAYDMVCTCMHTQKCEGTHTHTHIHTPTYTHPHTHTHIHPHTAGRCETQTVTVRHVIEAYIHLYDICARLYTTTKVLVETQTPTSHISRNHNAELVRMYYTHIQIFMITQVLPETQTPTSHNSTKQSVFLVETGAKHSVLWILALAYL